MGWITKLFGAMIRKLWKIAVCLFVAGSILALFTGTFLTVKGYKMYQKAMQEESLEERIAAVRNREYFISLDEISSEFKTQLLESEDKQFYEHKGINMESIVRAAVVDIKAGAFVQGGSTITQQLAKNLCFSSEKKIERKIGELFVVNRLEKEYTKDEILELYCNIIYFGENCYGVQAAAVNYFGVNASELDEKQALSLVFTIKCPNNNNPNVYTKEDEAA